MAKRRESLYLPGRRTNEWYKTKLEEDDDFVVCGYFDSNKANVTTLILGQYDTEGHMLDMGHVVLGRQRADYKVIATATRAKQPPFAPSKSEAEAVWLEPELVCTVAYSYRTKDGGMRHAKYKAMRDDKQAMEAVAPSAFNE